MSQSSLPSRARARVFAWGACVVASAMASPVHAQLGRGVVAHDRRDLPVSTSSTPVRSLAARRPLRGALGMPIIAGTFADVTPKYDRAVYDTAYFGPHAGVGPYSVARHYRGVSFGALPCAGPTTSWLTFPRPPAPYV